MITKHIRNLAVYTLNQRRLAARGLAVDNARAAVASLRNHLAARGEAGPFFGLEQGEGPEMEDDG